jgi:Fe-S-cluster containining protein
VSAKLCAACGLCCDGTLYGRVTLADTEGARLAPIRLPLAVHGEGQVLPQPCAAHGANGCTIYEMRPGSCARYECVVYKRVQRTEITLEAGVALVQRARRLADELRALLPSAERRPLIDTLGAVLGGATEDGGDRRAHGQLLLAAASLAAACRALDPRFGEARHPSGEEGPR